MVGTTEEKLIDEICHPIDLQEWPSMEVSFTISLQTEKMNSITEIQAAVNAKVKKEEAQYRNSSLNVTWASDVETKAVDWLWYPRIPKGAITLISGDPGVGKSNVVLAIATAISRGCPLPGEKEARTEASNVLLINTEDDIERTIVLRLKEMKADLSKIAIHRNVISRLGDGEHIFNLETDLPELALWVEQHQPILVVIDPIQAHIGKKTNMNQSNETRSILGPLALLAEKHRFTVIIICHMNKAINTKALYRSLGSIDFIGVSRSALLVGEHQAEKGRRGLVQIKSNFGPIFSTLEFRIDPPDGRFSWVGESDLTTDDLLGIPGQGKRMSPERKEIVNLLNVKGQPMSPKEMAKELQKEYESIKRLMVRMARDSQINKTAYGKYISLLKN